MVRWLLGFTFRITVIVLGVVGLIVWPATPVQLSNLMFSLKRCDSPCLFGQTMQGKTPEQIVTSLHSSWAAEEIIYNGQMVSWNWNNVVWRAINQSSSSNQYNVINFDADQLKSLEVHFSLPLQDLIAVLGEPRFAFPNSYNQSFQLDYSLVFQNVSGRFSALTDCKQPKLLPETPVVYYIYRNDPKFNSPRSDVPYIVWQGYTDNLPDCSVFTP